MFIFHKKCYIFNSEMEKTIRYYELHADVCKIFGHPKRLMVIDTLRGTELTVTELAGKTGIDISNLSQHLHSLRDKGMITPRREGTQIFYRLSHPNIIKAYDLISEVLAQSITESHTILKKRKAKK
jgi:DNA-binding transcriptional ArsR family regulator